MEFSQARVVFFVQTISGRYLKDQRDDPDRDWGPRIVAREDVFEATPFASFEYAMGVAKEYGEGRVVRATETLSFRF